MKDLVSRYRRHGESLLIEMKLNSLAQLFTLLDPSPFFEKDLTRTPRPISWTRRASSRSRRRCASSSTCRRRRFSRTPPSRWRTRSTTTSTTRPRLPTPNCASSCARGRGSLLIGLTFLAACLSARELIAGLGTGTVYEIVQEGLLISGWVAMWRPIQIFLRLVADPQPAHALQQAEPHQGGYPPVFLSAQTPWTKPAACPCPTA